MLQARVIPCLLLQDGALVKTEKFKKRHYIGDPLNAVRIFNELEVDELVFLDIDASVEGREPPFKLLEEIASECFMPLAYGGGVTALQQVQRILSTGFEKVILNTAALENPRLISQTAEIAGSQAVVVSIDAKKSLFGDYKVFSHGGKKKWSKSPAEWAVEASSLGAGEILLNSIDRDGMMEGFDLDLIKSVTSSIQLPLVAIGGAGELKHLGEAINKAGASAVGVGSLVVFQGKNRSVLINFPTPDELREFIER